MFALIVKRVVKKVRFFYNIPSERVDWLTCE